MNKITNLKIQRKVQQNASQPQEQEVNVNKITFLRFLPP